jgi:hypothetical protein
VYLHLMYLRLMYLHFQCFFFFLQIITNFNSRHTKKVGAPKPLRLAYLYLNSWNILNDRVHYTRYKVLSIGLYIQSNSVITSRKGLNILCRYKRVLL